MTPRDILGLSLEALRAHRLRYGLCVLAIAVGVGAVVLLSSIGEGVRRYVIGQFSMFGTNIVGVHPGKVSTGGIPGGMGGGARKLTLDDARVLRRLPGVASATATASGTALVEHGDRGRRVYIFGVTAQVPQVWSMRVASGSFLPDLEWDRSSPVVVLGPRLKRELFREENALGTFVRIGNARYRVIGVMESKGTLLGFDMDDTAYIPVMSALRLFNLGEISEVNLLAATTAGVDSVVERARRTMIDRHGGEEDVTIVSQKDALQMVDGIMRVLTLTVTAIAAISLLVGAIGILTILWIVVRERTQEIGLVKALGGTRLQILVWYLCEAALTAVAGGGVGLLAGAGMAAALSRIVPGLSTHTPPAIMAAAIGMAVSVGVLAGIAPAMRAARLNPVEALRAD
jgi:putative ABC transport system permease protein